MDHNTTSPIIPTHHNHDNNLSNSTYHDYGVPTVAALSLLLIISMIMALVGNVMVIITISRHKGMRTRTNMLLGNLAVADILVALIDMPIALVTIISHDWIFTPTFCILNGFAVGLGLMLSVHTLMWISIHKFISITRPFARTVTPFQIVLMMVVAWVWTIAYNLTATPLIGMTQIVYKKGSSQCGPVVPKDTSQLVHSALNTFFNLVMPMAVMIYCYYRIFKEVKDHLDRMRDFADVSVRNSLIQQKRITETLCIVLIMFFVFWAPYILYSMSLVFCGEVSCIPLVLNPITYLCGYMSSACNPVIYALRSPSFRRGFQEIIFRKKSHQGPYRGHRVANVTSHHQGMLVSFRKSLLRASGRAFRRGRQERNKHTTCTHAPKPPEGNHRVPALHEVTTHPLEDATERKDGVVTFDVPETNGDAGRIEDVELEADSADGMWTLETTLPPIELSSDSFDNIPLEIPTCSASSNDVTDIPWRGLALQTDPHISRSCREIVAATTQIMTKSASASDFRSLARSSSTPEPKAHEPSPKRRHMSEIHRPLMWQASIDHLSPTLDRRFPYRKNAIRCRPGEDSAPPRPLRLKAVLNNIKRSFSDLFNIDEDY